MKNFSGSKNNRGKIILPGVLVCILISIPSIIHPEKPPLRTINIKIAADVEFKTRYQWDTKIYDLVSVCSSRFRRHFGLCLHISGIEYWKPREDLNCLEDSYNELRSKINPQDCDIVLGIVSAKYISEYPYGISDFCNGYILVKYIEPGEDFGIPRISGFLSNKAIRYFKYKDDMELILLHELCHMFGAVDLDEEGSVMGGQNPGSRIDEFTLKIISASKNRTFTETNFPLDKRQLEEVIGIFKERRCLNRDEPQVMCFLANLLLEKGEYKSAILECQKGLCLNPLQHELLCLLGRAYRRAGQLELAISQYLKALVFKPANSDYHFNLGLAYLDAGMTPLAIKEFRKAIELNPRCAMFHYNLGVAFSEKNMLDSAIHEFKKAIKLEENFHRAYSNLAQSYLKKGMIAEGIVASKAALGMNPVDAHSYSNLGWAYLLHGKLDDAEKCCLKAIDLDPWLPQPHNFLGVLYTRRNAQDLALKEFKKAIELFPDYSEAHYNLADLYFQNNKISLSIYHYKKVIAIDPVHVAALLSLANIHYLQKKYSRAWDYVVEAEKSGANVRPEFKLKVLTKLGVKGPDTEQNLKR